MDNLVLTVVGSVGFGAACGLLLERWKRRRLLKRTYRYRLEGKR